ncbi:MAG: TerB family tellurite resistance protein [Deltaproteobacteria bacterium]|nr:TerB family tellurite resistance protein [Deltaproteobacteria bacterium]
MDDVQASLLRRVMVRMAVADGRLHDAEVSRLRWNVRRLTGRVPTVEQVQADAVRLKEQGCPLETLLDEVRNRCNTRTRRMVVQAGYIIATADGEVPASEEALLLEIARALGIGPTEFHALVSPMALARALEGS